MASRTHRSSPSPGSSRLACLREIMKVGFIGLGHMGAPMSSNVLAAGHELVVHDVRPDAAARPAGRRRRLVGGIARRVQARTATPSSPCCRGPARVEDVLLGPGGLLRRTGRSTPPGLTCPPASRRWRTRCGAVAGPGACRSWMRRSCGMDNGRQGRHAADLRRRRHRGRLVRVRPLLEVMGDPERILHVGTHGAGYTVKLMLNLPAGSLPSPSPPRR